MSSVSRLKSRCREFNAVTDGDAAEQDELKLFKSDAGQYVKFYDFISQARNLDLNRPDFRSYREPCSAGAGCADSWLA